MVYDKLSDICEYAKGKTSVDTLDVNTYISTENMLSNRGGITQASALPSQEQTQGFSAGDVLVSNIRPYFKKIWYATFDGGCSNDVLVFRATKGVNSQFLYYVLSDDTFFEYSMATSKGTKMPRGDRKAIMEYAVPRFSYDEQKKIVGILSAIDAKINLNRKINENLNWQLQAIFKAYFTENPDFEVMKKIPLSDLCHIVTKGTTPTTLGKPFVDRGINFIKAESILDNHSMDTSKFAYIDEETNALLKRSIIHAGDIVFTIAGTLGRFALIDGNVLPANTNQAVAIIRANTEKIMPEYLYSCFIGEWHNDYYSKRVQQAVQANLSLATIKSLPIPLLCEEEMVAYLGLISPIITAIKENDSQNKKLSMLRNALLPKLMSGEIDLQEV